MRHAVFVAFTAVTDRTSNIAQHYNHNKPKPICKHNTKYMYTMQITDY